MSSPIRRKHAPFTVRSFKAFLDTRPDEERWELVDGLPMPSAARRIAHQRIASNFERHLNDALRARKPEWRADREIGIEVSDESTYRPEPEVTVIDTDTDADRTYADRFHLVMEVPSESDKGKVLESKIEFYRLHPTNQFIVIVDQDAVEVMIHRRLDAEHWAVEVLTTPDQDLVLGDIGVVCTVGELYENTRLDPRRVPGIAP